MGFALPAAIGAKVARPDKDVWCVAGELNLPYYLSPDFPNHGEKQTAEWEKVLAYARSINAFDRPITAHPTGVGRLSMRGARSKPLPVTMMRSRGSARAANTRR